LIGAQQSRKVKQIPGACDVFQALDRLKTAEMLNAELVSRNQQLPVLLEVNVDAEPQKHGFDLAALESAVSGISQNCPQLLLQGLMAYPGPVQRMIQLTTGKCGRACRLDRCAQCLIKLKRAFPN
jgi:uncharacterized pyridoxal phosphate-containing UPF0001 family protein